MARGPHYTVRFRRRREGKTNYYLRRKLLISRKHRFVVRKTSKHLIVQIIAPHIKGDKTLVSVHTKELIRDFGWKASTGNLSAAYLVGYIAGKKALAKGIKEAILDIGLTAPVRGSRPFAALKGALDAGLEIPHNENVLPAEDRIRGQHIVEYYQLLSQQSNKGSQHQFSKIKSGGLDIAKLSEHFDATKKKIDSYFEKKTTKKATKKKTKKTAVKTKTVKK
ncbi:MAG: 50S ribosomal protein L18 [Candidatus Odinarchaeia archaeon]